jgi:hypothetical protein
MTQEVEAIVKVIEIDTAEDLIQRLRTFGLSEAEEEIVRNREWRG